MSRFDRLSPPGHEKMNIVTRRVIQREDHSYEWVTDAFRKAISTDGSTVIYNRSKASRFYSDEKPLEYPNAIVDDPLFTGGREDCGIYRLIEAPAP